ncbi:MAG: hypothetical protein HY396_00455 [Candidatus Doudnabacteria bacterium]|nr:hypothetical protein [Candidatus Doudnabacteria bacterium]
MAKQSALTKEHFDKVLKTVAKKTDLDRTNKTLDRVVKTLDATVATLNRTAVLLTHVAEDVSTLKEDLGFVKETLDSHTTSLDKILKNSETSKTETAALQNAVRRHEEWIKQIAERVGMKLATEIEPK